MAKVFKSKSGFTLVELSIVIIIIGFLIAGIASARSLIKTVELNSIVTDLTTIKTAIKQFQNIYHALPGDMTNAYAYFGGPNCTDDVSNLNVGEHPCNGLGFGSINADEGIRAWYHMSQAKLIPGSYSNTFVVASQADETNSYTTKTPNVGFYLEFWWPPLDATNPFGSLMYQGIFVGGFVPGGFYSGLSFTPVDMKLIDTKIDDGVPASGMFSGGSTSGNPGNCYSGNEYNLGVTDLTCRGGLLGYEIR